MRSLRPFIVAMVFLMAGIASLSTQTRTTKPKSPVLRQPFTVRLKLDKEHYDEFHYDKQPYVSENEVYLFLGDKFGVNVTVRNDRIVDVKYQPDAAKADVWFGFEQPPELPGGLGMTLAIENNMKRGLSMDGLMSVPNKKEVIKTSIQSVPAGKKGLETWPHPISQLVLGNLQLTQDSGAEPKK
jgi:hypothetical protein